ncbi:recombinase family protein [Streptomyces sp. SAI-129]|uniref:recombinase family protein n=1 Tax=Streptomyces sp. SAI-129 TaxID=3377727 RepID=UPI003C7A25D5
MLRVSTPEQVRGYGLGVQESAGRAYIAGRSGWTLPPELIFRDEGVSGATVARPGMLRLEQAARQGLIDVVVVHSFDRIGRTTQAFWSWIWALEDLGVSFVSATEDIDTATEAGRLQLQGRILRAEAERTLLCERTQGGRQRKALDGGWVGGPPPWGYAIDKAGGHRSTLVVDEGEARVVRKAVSLVVDESHNVSETARELNTLGYLTRSGRPWTGSHGSPPDQRGASERVGACLAQGWPLLARGSRRLPAHRTDRRQVRPSIRWLLQQSNTTRYYRCGGTNSERVARFTAAMQDKEAALARAIATQVVSGPDHAVSDAALRQLAQDVHSARAMLDAGRQVLLGQEAVAVTTRTTMRLAQAVRGASQVELAEMTAVIGLLDAMVKPLGEARRRSGVKCKVTEWHERTGTPVPVAVARSEWPMVRGTHDFLLRVPPVRPRSGGHPDAAERGSAPAAYRLSLGRAS